VLECHARRGTIVFSGAKAPRTSGIIVCGEVVYGDPPVRTYRNLWVITLLADGLCSAFEEWPFHPDQPLAAQ